MRSTLLTCFFLSGAVFSTEIDSFTLRDPYMPDATEKLNAIMQGYFDKVLIKANESISCKPEVLENAFHKITGGLFWSNLENDIEKSDIIDRRSIAVARSIYRDVSFIEGPALYLARLGYLMKIGDFYIGSDKLGHFIDQGFDYLQYPSLDKAFEFGEMTERTYYGLETTAVYSYGDLAANLDGYFFWSQLTQGKDPYFTCSENTWVQQRKFDWADYASAAWDEGINCNYYKTVHIAHIVNRRIAELGMACPIDQDKNYCQEMIEHYGYLAPHVVTQECFTS